ncbi:MAG: hypothetical protein MI921_28830 [Cytophagales bacterium]|nr:hypothetical protein [Cytophagales bacterium]
MRIKGLLTIPLLVFLLSTNAFSQTAAFQEEEIKGYEEKVKSLVSFLNFAMNTIGDEQTSAREKEIIITQSYLKAFRDEKVQVEDDLVENRDVVTNKDVQAYLKDIDFFFHNVKFELNIDKVEHYVNAQNTLFFKVSITRNLNGVTIEGEQINNTMPRFIEINVDDRQRDLRIVSIYTTKLSIEDDLRNWWTDLSFEWKSIFKREIGAIDDSLNTEQLLRIADMQHLNIDNNRYIQDIGPLTKVTGLRSLSMSNTQIDDLLPLRNLTNLESLNFSYTTVEDVAPLKYAIGLKELVMNNTNVDNVADLGSLDQLEKLDISYSRILSIDPIAHATVMKDLNLSFTQVNNLDFAKEMQGLKTLELSGTPVSRLNGLEEADSLEVLNISQTIIDNFYPLEGASNLKYIFADSTEVRSLEPLSGMSSLEKVYCDNTEVDDEEVRKFKRKNPNVLVIHKSENMESWWSQLSFDWKAAMRQSLDFEGDPSKDQLARMTYLEKLDVGGSNVVDLVPLRALRNLKSLKCHNTSIADLEPIGSLTLLEELDISSTSVQSLHDLSSMINLKRLIIDGTYVDSLNAIDGLKSLEYLSCENTAIHIELIEAFAAQNRQCLVIYQSETLQGWWDSLSSDWRTVFQGHMDIQNTPDPVQLHTLANIERLSVENDFDIISLRPLKKLTRLKELRINNTTVSDLGPVEGLKELTYLQVTKSPVKSLEPIRNLTGIRHLDISNTPIDTIEPITILTALDYLKFSGTGVKSIKALSYLIKLKHVEFDNTNVSSLSPIMDLFNLETLVCYNTRLSQKKVQKFQSANPGCKVTFY